MRVRDQNLKYRKGCGRCRDQGQQMGTTSPSAPDFLSQYASPEAPRACLVGAAHPPPQNSSNTLLPSRGVWGPELAGLWKQGLLYEARGSPRALGGTYPDGRSRLSVCLETKALRAASPGCVRGTDFCNCGETVFNISETGMAIRKS